MSCAESVLPFNPNQAFQLALNLDDGNDSDGEPLPIPEPTPDSDSETEQPKSTECFYLVPSAGSLN